jgi:DNA-directed RNA polymerase specialized sigma24 family protein
MRPEIPIDFLLRWAKATPEQRAAAEKCLSAVPLESPAPVTLDVARTAFALVVKMDARGKQKAPTALTVFRLYCVEELSADRVAAKCRCGKGTVMSRLRQIEQATNTKPEQFRAMSDHLRQMVEDYETSGAREVYRRGLVDGEE